MPLAWMSWMRLVGKGACFTVVYKLQESEEIPEAIDNLTAVEQIYLYPPPRKNYENNSPRIVLCNFWGRLRQNCVITKKLIPQK